MKKQVRTLVIISAAVLVLVGLLLALIFLLPEKDEEESSETSSQPTIKVVSKTADSEGKTVDQPVKRVEIKNEKDEFIIAQNDEKQLLVKGYEDLPVGTYEIESLTGELSSLTASREISSDSVNLDDYGLDKPRATAEVTYHDDSKITFELGNDASGDAGCYVRIDKKGPIYVVNSYFAEQLLKESVMYIGTSLITPPEARKDDTSSGTGGNDTAVMKNMKLSGTVRKEPLEFGVNTRTDDSAYSTFNYLITSPLLKGTGDSAANIAQSATSLDAVRAVKAHPTAAQLKEYGLDKPYSVCELTLAVQTSASTDDDETVTTYYNSTKHIIKLGKKDKDGNYYALVDDYNAVYLLSSGSVPWAETQFNDIVTPLLFLRDITTVKSIEVNAEGRKTTFELTHYPEKEDRDESLVVKAGGKTYPTDDFRSLYQVFMSIYRYNDADKKPTGNPDIAFTVNPIDPKDTKVNARFYRNDASLYTCVLSDKDVFTVKASEIDKFIRGLTNYLDGKPVTA
jgi:hypothetical protein